MQYEKMRAMINEEGNGSLTENQKKLPPALQKTILEKMKKEGELSEEAEAAYSKLLSKDDQKKEEVGPEGEMKIVEKKDA